MTLEQIETWIDERIQIPARHEYHETPTSSTHRVTYETGETYEQRSTDITLWSQDAEYIINGETVYRTTWTYSSDIFGWMEATHA